MCSEMSQSIPNSAVISETTMIPAGIAAQSGSPDTRRLKRPSRPSIRDLAAAMAEPEPEQDDGDEQRGAGRDRDLVEGGAAGGFRGEESEHGGQPYRRLMSRCVM